MIKKPIVWLCLIVIFYFVTRLINLTALPIFTDEAIYIRWSQIGAQDAGWRFISLTDGKQPLFTWFVMAAIRVFSDPLFAGRFVSVVSGSAGMIGMFFLGKELFSNTRIGVIASILYIISPFTLMYDRMALYDSLVAAFSIWNLYLAILLVRRIRLDVALIFGLTLGVGMLNKTNAFFSLYLLPVTIVLFDWKKERKIPRLLTWIGLCVLSAVLSQAIYGILRLSPFFYLVSLKDALFVYPLREWITHPFLFLQGNLHGEFDWLINYLTIPLLLASFAALVLDLKKIMEKFLLVCWWFAPFFALSLFGKVLYPRFLLFMSMPLLILSAYSIDWILGKMKNRFVQVIIIAVLCLPSLYNSHGVIADIASAHIPKSEIGQYINDWPSGWGTLEISGYLQEESLKAPLAVYTEGTFGLLPYALEIYLNGNSQVEIHGVWPPAKTIPDDIRESAQKKPTYYITNLTQTVPEWPLELILEYQKGNNEKSHIRLYKVVLQKK